MIQSRHRLLIVLSHPVQYVAPLLRRMAAHRRLEIMVAYASLRGAERSYDPGFGREVVWDVPLLDGYPWCIIHTATPGAGELENSPARRPLGELIAKGGFDAAYVGGYNFREAWQAFFLLHRHELPLLFSCEAHSLDSWRVQTKARRAVKKYLLRRFYRHPDRLLAGSTGTIEFLVSLGVSRTRIRLAGNVVDNDWWLDRASRVNRESVRVAWGIPLDAPVALFCAKLQPWKRPGDALEAFSQSGVNNSFLVFAGEGPLLAGLKRRAWELGIDGRVRWLGFVNQTQLPAVYVASDMLLLPSSFEPFGLVVNEAMLCGCPAIVSHRVGAKYDLVREGETGFVISCGDVLALATRLRQLCGNPELVRKMGAAARARMNSWRPEQNVDVFADAVADVAAEWRPRATR
jgi:glycosyltransferase involved in cell wall biosynthesis